ncbi:hypothetical protein ARMGADRAFT_1033241 [Armillaria gallica]|uniref:CxC5 like cysteine cluster associated with KDZ domain-containing protein n=1 Tax=Armillaria gallica TaxID=47427 RepID=A0A2H3D370_ARMGA|nr:hypothetical protein ARMGADRAFT_1033241 [Armillaria gallica]
MSASPITLFIFASLLKLLPEDSELGRTITWEQLLLFSCLSRCIAPATYALSQEYLKPNKPPTGHQMTITFDVLEQTTKLCCGGQELQVNGVTEARLYTVSRGIFLVYVKSYYCHKCHTRYMPDYKVMAASNGYIAASAAALLDEHGMISPISASASSLAQWYNDGLQSPATNVSNNFVLNNKLTAELIRNFTQVFINLHIITQSYLPDTLDLV